MMIDIDIDSGALQIGKRTFTPADNLNDIRKKFSSEEFELQLLNNEWATYKLDITNDFIVRIIFYQNLIKFIEMYPRQISNNESKGLEEILKNLGGENRYSWGNVELNNDHKAGYKSILIKY